MNTLAIIREADDAPEPARPDPRLEKAYERLVTTWRRAVPNAGLPAGRWSVRVSLSASTGAPGLGAALVEASGEPAVDALLEEVFREAGLGEPREVEVRQLELVIDTRS